MFHSRTPERRDSCAAPDRTLRRLSPGRGPRLLRAASRLPACKAWRRQRCRTVRGCRHPARFGAASAGNSGRCRNCRIRSRPGALGWVRPRLPARAVSPGPARGYIAPSPPCTWGPGIAPSSQARAAGMQAGRRNPTLRKHRAQDAAGPTGPPLGQSSGKRQCRGSGW